MSAPQPASKQRLEISLIHVHLPLLDDANVIEYDQQTDRIEPSHNLEVVESVLEATPEGSVEAV
nr:hypothetical protein [Halobiforma nitratireducens]